MKYYIITFGCQMNKSDSERIARVLENIGYKPASNIKGANLILVNACSVRQSAVDRVYGLGQKFLKLKTKNKKLKTILTGCILEKDRKKFKDRFDLILDTKNLLNWPKILSKKNISSIQPWPVNERSYLSILPKYTNNFSAFIPISNGCNDFCAYCVVPYVRGQIFCRDHTEILEEVKNVVQKGFKQIWLLGQNVNHYHSPDKHPKNGKINFAKLLKMINDIPGNFWIGFTSPHPKNFSDQLIETIAQCQKIRPYLNLPVQSGDNEILEKMNRNYTVRDYKILVKKIKNAFKKYRTGMEKEIAISTDLIVGFPGETKEQFENTAKLFKEIKFDMAYIAKYSPRPGTVAFKLKDYIPFKEKEKRWRILNEILKKTALKKNKNYIGKEMEVLIEKANSKFLFGKTKTYKTVKLPIKNYKIDTNLVGQFAKVKITSAHPFGFRGKLC